MDPSLFHRPTLREDHDFIPSDMRRPHPAHFDPALPQSVGTWVGETSGPTFFASKECKMFFSSCMGWRILLEVFFHNYGPFLWKVATFAPPLPLEIIFIIFHLREASKTVSKLGIFSAWNGPEAFGKAVWC
jgi:hypothetical protein